MSTTAVRSLTKTARLSPAWVLINGVEQHFPDASYYTYYQEQSGKRIWKKMGPELEVRAADFQESYMRGVHAGVPVKTKDIPIMVGHTLEPYLEEYKLSHRLESHKLMKQTLYESFTLSAGKTS